MSAPDRQAAQTFAQTCRRCGQSKAAEEFGFRNEALEQRHRRCKVCVAAYGREHYASNRQAYITRNVATMRERRRGLKERVWRYLADQACVDCGERDRSSWSLTTSNVRRSAWRFTGWRSQPSRGQRSRPRSRSAKSDARTAIDSARLLSLAGRFLQSRTLSYMRGDRELGSSGHFAPRRASHGRL